MQIAVNRTVRKLKRVSIDGIGAWLLFLVLLFMLWYWWYIKLAYSRTVQTIEEKQQEFVEKRRILTETQKHPWYLKLLTAKYLEEETKTVNWEQSLTYLTTLLEELRSYNKQQKSVDLTNFQIDATKVTLQGMVGALKDIYAEWGIIDKFASYPFIKHFKLPYYVAAEVENDDGTLKNGYNFLLDADIYHYDWIKPTP